MEPSPIFRTRSSATFRLFSESSFALVCLEVNFAADAVARFVPSERRGSAKKKSFSLCMPPYPARHNQNQADVLVPKNTKAKNPGQSIECTPVCCGGCVVYTTSAGKTHN